MTVTLTANYTEFLAEDTVSKIEELLEDSHDLEAMLTFIDEYNETAFVEVYEEYVRCGEAIGYEAVDALADEDGIYHIEGCDERYQGFFHNEADFAEHFHDERGDYVPEGIVVDWQATWDQNLSYDYTACNDGSTYRPCHIFSDN
jgi:hypothetical protein